MARTTAVELKGDRYKAEQLSLAHTQRLLRTFRENSAFQSLQQNKHEENFFDETGAYIGKISMQTVFGVEKVIVDVRSGKPRPQKEEWVLRTRQVNQIVPCIRSVDNLWWVACLSGTFAGPYYAFKNIYEILAAEMDDNVEGALNNKLISVGAAPLGGGDLPKLFFIAQTGERPSAEEVEWSESITEVDDPYYRDLSIGEKAAFYVLGETCCEGGYEYLGGPGFKACFTMTPPPYSFTKKQYQEFRVFGTQAALPNTEVSEIGNTTSVYAGACSDVWGDCETATGFALVRHDQWIDEISAGTDYPGIVNSTLASLNRVVSTFGYDGKSVRVERENVENVASCYTITDTTETLEYSATTSGGCVVELGSSSVEETIEQEYSYCFRVDTNIFLLRGPSSDQYPVYFQPIDNEVKYYNTDSIAAVTGMMSALLVNDWESADILFEYNYVGPNSEGLLAPYVRFTATYTGTIYEHTISEIVDEEEDLILFGGEIFLGMIQYTVTEKKQVYS